MNQSAEQGIYDYLKKDESVRNKCKGIINIGKASYETVASMLGIPTFIRKVGNGQTILQRGYKKDSSFDERSGLGLGIWFGVLINFYLTSKIISSAMQKDYTPLAVWAGLNLTSAGSEYGKILLKNKRKKKLEDTVISI